MNTPLQRGDVVRATAGHDAGELFVVWELLDGEYVLLINGKTRTLEKPKKKKRKHLKAVPAFHMELGPEARLLDADFRKFLKSCDQNLV